MRATTPALVLADASPDVIRAVNRVRLSIEVNATVHRSTGEGLDRMLAPIFADLHGPCQFDTGTGEETSESKTKYDDRLKVFLDHWQAVIQDLRKQLARPVLAPCPGATVPAPGGVSAAVTEPVDIDLSQSESYVAPDQPSKPLFASIMAMISAKASRAKGSELFHPRCKLHLCFTLCLRICGAEHKTEVLKAFFKEGERACEGVMWGCFPRCCSDCSSASRDRPSTAAAVVRLRAERVDKL